MASQPQKSEEEKPAGKRRPLKGRRALFWLVLLLWLALLTWMLMKSCREEPKPPAVSRKDTLLVIRPVTPDSPVTEDTIETPEEVKKEVKIPVDTTPAKSKKPELDSNEGKYQLILADSTVPETGFIDSLYVYADPWGGRHFDSVTVTLHCREGCIIVYSTTGKLGMKSYGDPITIRRNTDLWIAGINEKGEQTEPVKITYIIEKEPGDCPDDMLPVGDGKGDFCMDVYEWPNRKGEKPTPYVNHAEAADSCKKVGKRLCTAPEWQLGCGGEEDTQYPYGNRYNENYCFAKEESYRRSGRAPACRSYYGIHDLTGNLWEWTATPSSQKEGSYLAAGGNWDAGNRATCRETKYSFYPQNRYLFVGFRCCKEP